MAHIRSCFVDGLARQFTREIHFHPQLNVIFGGNGSGKTSLLKVLHSALSNDLQILKRVALDRASVAISGPANTPSLFSPLDEMVRFTPLDRPLVELLNEPAISIWREKKRRKWESTELSEDKDKAIRHTYLPLTRLYLNPQKSQPGSPEQFWAAVNNSSEDDFDKNFAETINFLWLRYTRNVGIDVQIEQAKGLRQIVLDFLLPEETADSRRPKTDTSGASAAGYEKLMSFLQRQSPSEQALLSEEAFIDRMLVDWRMRRVIADVESVEDRVEAIQRPRTELERVLRQMISGGKHIFLQDKDVQAIGAKSEHINLEDLSSGEKQLLRIFIDVLLAEGDPIIIDEPELSLHIDWQRRLLGVLRRLAPKSQIIVATHSPEIMADVDEEHIIEL